MREHSWLKYFPWKELYEKTLPSPFEPKNGDNFDAKYCNTPEKIGLETMEKYETYLKDEESKQTFKDFFFYFNDLDENDPKNSKEKKYYNPHLNIVNNNENDKSNMTGNQSSTYNMKENYSNEIDDKFAKIKEMSSNISTNNVLKHNRDKGSSQGSTNNSNCNSMS